MSSDNNRGKEFRVSDKRIDRYFVACILICFSIGVLSFAYFIRQGGGAFSLRNDFNTQILPFYNHINGFLKNSLPGEWCWSLDLGASFINGFSYYGLGSPFAWISFILPRDLFPYVVGWIFIFKYAAAGAAAYMYLRTMTGESGWSEVIGAVAYAFSGFQATNILFYIFHDAVALFPLMLIGIERLMKGKSSLFFAFSVFINCLTNYYFFVGECIFLVIYFLIRFWGRGLDFLKGMAKCLFAGILGTGMACILFVPSILYIFGNYNVGNPRTSNMMNSIENLIPDLDTFLYILKGILLPGDTMHNHIAIHTGSWTSTACWIPLTGFSLPAAYVLKKRDWLAIILVLLGIVSFSPFLSSSFTMFTQNYQRWWYMLILMGVLAGTLVVKNIEIFPVRTGVLLNLIVLVSFYAVVQQIEKSGEEPGKYIFHPQLLKMYVIVSAAGLIFMLLFRCLGAARFRPFILLAAVSISACAMTFHAIYRYKMEEETTQEVMTYFHIADQLEEFDSQYRYEFEYWDNYYPFASDVGGVGSFTSTSSNSRYVFEDLFDYSHPGFSMNKNAITGLPQLLGSKYVMKNNADSSEKVIKEFAVDKQKMVITERPACPIGFKVNFYILKDDLMDIKKKKRGIALLNAAVIEKKDENLVVSAAKKITKKEIDFDEDIIHAINRADEQRVLDFEKNSTGFKCVSDYDEESLVYFSVPEEKGWIVTIDGENTEFIDSGGMILLKVPAGKHNIDFTFFTPGFREGRNISIISFAIFIILAVIEGIRKKQRMGIFPSVRSDSV